MRQKPFILQKGFAKFCCLLHLIVVFCYRFVSDYAYDGYKALCQHKLIQAMQKSVYGPETARTYPLSLLEWTANRKKANMVLQVHCFDGESDRCSLSGFCCIHLLNLKKRRKYKPYQIPLALFLYFPLNRHSIITKNVSF